MYVFASLPSLSCELFEGSQSCGVYDVQLPNSAAALKKEGITWAHRGSTRSVFRDSAAYVTAAPKPLFSSLTTCARLSES